MTNFKNKYKAKRTANFNPVAKTTTQPLKSGKQNADAIIMKIAKSFKDRSRKDIQSWRNALLATEHNDTPRFNRYFDLVDDVKTDGTFKTQVLLRKSATLSVGFQVRNTKSGELNEEATALLQQKWFYQFLNKQLDATIYGTKVIEFLEFNGNHIKFSIIPERNTVPVEKRVYPDLSNDKKFIQYNDDSYKPWVIELNSENPLGLINDIIPNLIWKRNVTQSWAEFCEKFGMPMVSATTNNNNAAHIDKVEQQLLALAEASVGVFPEGTTIKFDEANRTDAYNVYSKFIEQNSDEISGVIVGSNTLGSNESNRSNTEVHERSLDYKISQADRRDIAFTVNDDLFPLLKMQGYNFISDDDVFEWVEGKEEIDLNQFWTVVNGIMQEYEVEQDWLSETFNIPIVGKKKSINLKKNDTEEQKTEATALFNVPKYPTAVCCPEHNQPIAAGKNKVLDQLTEKLLKALWDSEDTNALGAQTIVEEALELVNGLKSGFGVTVGWNTPDTLAMQMMEYNLFEFSASKTEARLAAMTDLLIDKEKNEIRLFEDFKKLAQTKVLEDFNEHWLRTEYNLSIAVGQTSAQYLRAIEGKDRFSWVQYKTIGDSNVRKSHEKLDGKYFNLSDKEAMKLWPPNGYGCRCEMVRTNRSNPPQNLKMSGDQAQGILSADDDKWATGQFNINRGDIKEVFTKKQFYSDIKGLPEKLNDMTFDKYDLPKYNTFKNDLNPIKIDKSITSDNVGELFKKVNNEDYMRFTDYFGRKMVLKEKTFKQHTSGKYVTEAENRHRLFPHVKDALNNPDEVWYNQANKIQGKFQSRYIKFYKDLMLIVDCDFDSKKGLNVLTWYKGKVDEKQLRKGLKIK